MMMEICQEIRNWFDKKRIFGTFEIKNGVLTKDGTALPIAEGQYFRIVDSTFNDGVFVSPYNSLVDEIFDGAVWLMAVPPTVISLAKDIEDWQAKFGGVDSVNMSPYNSESFGGYSYSKSGGGSASGASGAGGTWQSAFASRLNMWRKIR